MATADDTGLIVPWAAVEQGEDDQGRTIAVNAWYDMAFDLRWVHAGLVNRLAAGLGLVELSSAEPDDEGGSSEE